MRIFLFIIFLFLFEKTSFAQIDFLPFDTLNRNEIELTEINLRHGNSYRFNTYIESDTFILLLPTSLPKGYYEAFYKNDTNKLALSFYNFGNKPYAQQFYADGSMKADSEYDKYGYMHGMHVVYNSDGNELWHADYWHGHLDKRNDLKYLDYINYSSDQISNGKAFGCYTFNPTPMRERQDEIEIRADGSFSFHNYKANCDCNRHSEGKWTLKNNILEFFPDKKEIWQSGSSRRFVIIEKNGKNPYLIEYSEYGLNWYSSEFRKCKKCQCFKK